MRRPNQNHLVQSLSLGGGWAHCTSLLPSGFFTVKYAQQQHKNNYPFAELAKGNFFFLPVLTKQLTKVSSKFYNLRSFAYSWPKNSFCTGKKFELIEGLAGKKKNGQQWQSISQLNNLLHNSSVKDKNKVMLNLTKKGNIIEQDSSSNLQMSPPTCRYNLEKGSHECTETLSTVPANSQLTLSSKSMAGLIPTQSCSRQAGNKAEIQSVWKL